MAAFPLVSFSTETVVVLPVCEAGDCAVAPVCVVAPVVREAPVIRAALELELDVLELEVLADVYVNVNEATPDCTDEPSDAKLLPSPARPAGMFWLNASIDRARTEPSSVEPVMTDTADASQKPVSFVKEVDRPL